MKKAVSLKEAAFFMQYNSRSDNFKQPDIKK